MRPAFNDPYIVDGEICGAYGPYDTRREAEDARRGHELFLARCEKRDW